MGETMDRVSTIISKVSDNDIRTILGICQQKRKYPKDCITDGGLEKLAQYIVNLESKKG